MRGSSAGSSPDEGEVEFRLWFKFVAYKGKKAVQVLGSALQFRASDLDAINNAALAQVARVVFVSRHTLTDLDLPRPSTHLG